jgi:hypothetical protein
VDLSKLRIIIVGPRHSGKNTLAAMLHEELDCCQTFDIGTYLIRRLAETKHPNCLALQTQTALRIGQNKDDFRGELIDLANYLRLSDPACFINKGFAAAPIVVGVRLHREMKAWLSQLGGSYSAHTHGLLIELRREGCLLRDGGDNFELTNACQTYLGNFASVMCVENNGSIEDLRRWAKLAAKTARGLVMADGGGK